jgi:multiple sugar transport system permease protein
VAAALGDALYVLPLVLVIGVLLVVPTLSALAHAFTDWQPGYESAWVGLDNFRGLAESEQFHQILKNQLCFLLGDPLCVLLPLVLATLLHERVPVPGVFRMIFLFPAIASPALIGILFTFLLAPDGPLNEGLRAVGLDALTAGWLSDERIVRLTIVVVLAWATVGVGTVIFSAALAVLPKEHLEAAELDGAGWWSRLRHVIAPALRGSIQLWTVILVVTVFLGLFPWIFTLTRGGPGYTTTTLDFDIYQNALSYGYFGTAAAESAYLLIIVAAIVLLGARLFRERRGA